MGRGKAYRIGMSDEREREPRIFFPLKQGSRTPEQFRAAVLGVIEKRRAREAADSPGNEVRSECPGPEDSALKTRA
jgi:hypothetical protein